jgi:hypothetical protein
VVALLKRVDSIREMSSLHPDRELPPKNIWLDDEELDLWMKECDRLRKEKAQESLDAW